MNDVNPVPSIQNIVNKAAWDMEQSIYIDVYDQEISLQAPFKTINILSHCRGINTADMFTSFFLNTLRRLFRLG